MNGTKFCRGKPARATAALLIAWGVSGAQAASSRLSGDLTAARYRATAEALMPRVVEGESAAAQLERTLIKAAASAAGTGSVACPGGGTLALARTVQARPGRATPGDRLQVTARDCIDKGPALTGRLEVDVLDVTESTGRAYVRMRLKALDFGSTQRRLDGRSIIEFEARPGGRQTVSVRFRGLTIKTPRQTSSLTHDYRYVREGGVSRVSVSGLVREQDKSYELRQRTSFEFSSAKAGWHKGALDVVDRDGDRVQVRASGASFTYVWQAARGSTPEPRSPAKEKASGVAKATDKEKTRTTVKSPAKAAAKSPATQGTAAKDKAAKDPVAAKGRAAKETATRGTARPGDL